MLKPKARKVPPLLQRFALKLESVKILKGLQRNPFKIFTVVLLIENCGNYLSGSLRGRICSASGQSSDTNKSLEGLPTLLNDDSLWVTAPMLSNLTISSQEQTSSSSSVS
jgi:hypothetical protein